MKAMIARSWGEPASLVYADVPDSAPRAGKVVVDVRAIGCNFPDLFKTFPLARAADALATIASRESYGKVVLVR